MERRIILSSEERRKKEKENRKNSILKAARKLFFERGFKSVTVDLIAAKAEVSKGSIYLYFDSKEEIYTQILISANIERHKLIESFSRMEGTAEEILLAFARDYVNFFLENNELFRILMTFMLHSENMSLLELCLRWPGSFWTERSMWRCLLRTRLPNSSARYYSDIVPRSPGPGPDPNRPVPQG